MPAQRRAEGPPAGGAADHRYAWATAPWARAQARLVTWEAQDGQVAQAPSAPAGPPCGGSAWDRRQAAATTRAGSVPPPPAGATKKRRQRWCARQRNRGYRTGARRQQGALLTADPISAPVEASWAARAWRVVYRGSAVAARCCKASEIRLKGDRERVPCGDSKASLCALASGCGISLPALGHFPPTRKQLTIGELRKGRAQ